MGFNMLFNRQEPGQGEPGPEGPKLTGRASAGDVEK